MFSFGMHKLVFTSAFVIHWLGVIVTYGGNYNEICMRCLWMDI